MKAAIIGVGRMGRRHVEVVRGLGLDLAGVCDLSRDSLDLASREQGVAADRLYTNPREMLERVRPDCVVVATTAPTHCEYTCLAAEAGVRYLLCEKPLAVSLDECDRMRAACEARGTRLAVNHQMRFMEQYTRPREIVYSEAFGGLSSVTVVAGNFGMAMNGTHYFEMFRYLTGEGAHEVAAWFSAAAVPNPRGPQFEDRAGAVRIVTPSGKRLYMDIGDDQGHGVRVVYAGPRGQLVVDELAGALTLSVREAAHRELPTTRYGMPSVETLERIAPADAVSPSRAVLRALLDGGDHPTWADGRLAVATLVAAYVSHENGHAPVRVDDGALPRSRTFPWA